MGDTYYISVSIQFFLIIRRTTIDYLIIFAVVRNSPVESSILGRRHTCAAGDFYMTFKNDFTVSCDRIDQCSGGETESDDSDDSHSLRLDLDHPRPSPDILARLPRESSFVTSASFLPSSIWQQRWNPASTESYTAHKFSEQVFDAACLGVDDLDNDTLMLEGSDIDEVAEKLLAVIESCIAAKDFTHLLACHRFFFM